MGRDPEIAVMRPARLARLTYPVKVTDGTLYLDVDGETTTRSE